MVAAEGQQCGTVHTHTQACTAQFFSPPEERDWKTATAVAKLCVEALSSSESESKHSNKKSPPPRRPNQPLTPRVQQSFPKKHRNLVGQQAESGTSSAKVLRAQRECNTHHVWFHLKDKDRHARARTHTLAGLG